MKYLPPRGDMPYYDYRCNNCNRRFESFNTMDNRYNATCPECGGSVTIVPSPFSFQFAVICSIRTHDGKLLNSAQHYGRVPPPRIPTPENKDIARAEREKEDAVTG